MHAIPGPHTPADHSGGPAGSPAAASRATASSAGAGASPAVAAHRGTTTASVTPLSTEDRALLTSMAPALATALVEVLVGARSAQTVERWVEGSLFERIVEHTRVRSALARGNPHADRPVGVSAARLCEVAESVVEISLVVRTTRRPRALALRLVRRRSRWRLSEFLSI
ncbi:Rv3235 family protein [Brevibacterium jeotgali]|nr:Rv3235 family protein [Brevibacterium jeotgali]